LSGPACRLPAGRQGLAGFLLMAFLNMAIPNEIPFVAILTHFFEPVNSIFVNTAVFYFFNLLPT